MLVLASCTAVAPTEPPPKLAPGEVVGTGLVIGLSRTGASGIANRKAIADFVTRNELHATPADLADGSASLVTLTSKVAAMASVGQKVNVTAVIQDDGSSLRGGCLMRATLKGADGRTYVVAQGALIVGTVGPAPRAKALHGGMVIRGRSH